MGLTAQRQLQNLQGWSERQTGLSSLPNQGEIWNGGYETLCFAAEVLLY